MPIYRYVGKLKCNISFPIFKGYLMLIKVTWYVYLWTLQLVLFTVTWLWILIMIFLMVIGLLLQTQRKHTYECQQHRDNRFCTKKSPRKNFYEFGNTVLWLLLKIIDALQSDKKVRSKIVIFSLVQNRSHKTSTMKKLEHLDHYAK